MPTILICSPRDLASELTKTIVFREDVRRITAGRAQEAQEKAVATRPHLVILDRDFPGGPALVSWLRNEPVTRAASIVVAARGEFDHAAVLLLEHGANAVLRLPAGPEWDDRLVQLITVPVRKDARFSVFFAVETLLGPEVAGVGSALNLSINGMLLDCSGALGIGDEIDLQFVLPGQEKGVLARGRVVRVARPGQFGIQLTTFAGNGRDIVHSFVESLSRG
jgi:CheY-like chemotaxis protein